MAAAHFSDPSALGIVAAFREEVSPLLRTARHVTRLSPGRYIFELGGKPVLLTVAGIGSENARRAATEMLNSRPLCGLLTVGFAAGLEQRLRPADVVIPAQVVDAVTGERFPCDPLLLPPGSSPSSSPSFSPSSRMSGTLLSVGEVIHSAAAKRALAARWSALAADMESAGVARAARLAGLPFAAVKSVTDSAEQSLAIDFQRCRSEHGELARWNVLRQALSNAQALRDLWRLAGASRRAANSLALTLSAA